MTSLLGWLAAAFLPALIGAPFTGREYYARLDRPSWAPPGWVFGPVWTALYATIGTSAWLVARRGGAQARGPLALWAAQAALNAAWTPVFFGLRAPGAALGVIGALWVAVAGTIVAFFNRRPAAGLLLLPYLAWVTFATVLNFEIWRRNR